MSEAVRIGGVQVRVNDDGTLFLYQPDPNRLMGSELAEDLVTWLTANVARPNTVIHTRGPEEGQPVVQSTVRDAAEQSSPSGHASSVTVPGGVIATSEGPVEPEAAPVKRRPGRPRKTTQG